MKKLSIGLIFLASVSSTAFAGDTWVNGYTKSDGTYVQGHYRSSPDGNSYNNWSTRGNVNPHTGKVGTKSPTYSSSYGGNSYNTSSSGSGANYNLDRRSGANSAFD